MSKQQRSGMRPLRGGNSLREGIRRKGRKRRNDLADVMASGPGRLRNDILPKLELVHLNPHELAHRSAMFARLILCMSDGS